MTETVRKQLSKAQVNEIGNILSHYKGKLFVKLVQIEDETLEFEYIEGKHPDSTSLKEFFFLLGQDHRLNAQTKNSESDMDNELLQLSGFITICHGDVHPKNIIQSADSFKLIDLTMVHYGLNYDDLDYLDLYSLFDHQKYSWLIKDDGLFEAYLAGAEISLNSEQLMRLRKLLAKRFIKKFIQNGEQNKIDISFEQRLLKKLNQ